MYEKRKSRKEALELEMKEKEMCIARLDKLKMSVRVDVPHDPARVFKDTISFSESRKHEKQKVSN
jgi:hypothetical protein